jgi:hypothetical protein
MMNFGIGRHMKLIQANITDTKLLAPYIIARSHGSGQVVLVLYPRYEIYSVWQAF